MCFVRALHTLFLKMDYLPFFMKTLLIRKLILKLSNIIPSGYSINILVSAFMTVVRFFVLLHFITERMLTHQKSTSGE